MSTDGTGYTDKGFFPIDIVTFMKEKEDEAIDIFETLNKSISDPLWQWLKIIGMERIEIELMHETAMKMLSIQDAVGTFLDKHGIECGIERKGESKSEGYVDVSATIAGIGVTLPAGTKFASASQNYISDEEATIPYTVTMTKNLTGASSDYFPSTVSYVNEIEKIKDENGVVINSSYYTLDSTYYNHIVWTEESSEVLSENSKYIVYCTGKVTKRVEVSSELTGIDTIATVGTVTTCVDYPSLSCTNSEDIDGGADEETDDAYRTRLLAARRGTFTLGSIKDIIMDMDSVRTCKVYQDVGTDQYSVANWDNPTVGGVLKIDKTFPQFQQSFVPGTRVMTLGRITLYGKPHNSPPALYCGVKSNKDAYSTGAGDYHDYLALNRWDVDPTATGMRDLKFDVKHNGLDITKTYRFDIWCEDPQEETFDWNSNYWEIQTSTEGYRADERGTLWVSNDSGVSYAASGTIDLMFKTHFKGAGFTSIIAPNDGYGFENIKPVIEDYLDYVEEGGYSPICIQSVISEADEVLIDIEGTVYISALADWDNVRREIEENIETYLEDLEVGDNVVYARIHQEIMKHTQVINLKDLKIKRQDVGSYDELDLAIQDDEIPDLGLTSFQRG